MRGFTFSEYKKKPVFCNSIIVSLYQQCHSYRLFLKFFLCLIYNKTKYLFLHLLAILFSWMTIKWSVSWLLIDIFRFSIFSIIILGVQTSKQLAFTLDSLIIALVPYPIWWSLSCIVNKIKFFPPIEIQCLLLLLWTL